MSESDKNFIGYEYKEIHIDSSKVPMYLDGYKNFGWSLDSSNITQSKIHKKVILYLKRDRKIMNKTELIRLQSNFEDCMHKIGVLENSKTIKATIISILIGLLGAMSIAGAIFYMISNSPIIWLSIILGVLGLISCTLLCFIYRIIIANREKVINPLIENKYDEIYEICKKANKLLSAY